MKQIYRLFYLLVFLFIGCESVDDSVISEITIPSQFQAIELESSEVSQEVTFSTTSEWTISLKDASNSTPTWLKVSPMSGSAGSVTLDITVDENRSFEDRSATILISTNETEKSISLTQVAFEPILSLSTTTLSESCVASSIDIYLTSNLEWQTSDIPDWITLSSSTGTGSQIVTISYAENTTTQMRSATIKFSNTDYSKEADITITQAAFEPTLSLSKNSNEIATDSDSFTIDVTSNLEWQTSNVPDWITLSPLSGIGNQTVTISYTENTTTQTRSAIIKFNNTEYNKEADITIIQAAFDPTLSLSENSKNVTIYSDSFTIDVTSNLEWQVSDIPDWITLSPQSGIGSQTVTMSYTENTTTQARSATIRFSNADYSKEASITITQAAFEPTLSLSENSKYVTIYSNSFTIDVTSNLEWQVSNVPDWITLSALSGTGSQTVTMNYTENTTTQTRSATIKFSDSVYGKEVEIMITQVAFEPILSLSKNSENVAIDSDSFTVDVTSNLEWTTSDVPDWITLTPSSGSGNKTVTVNYTTNTTTQARSATIKFCNADYGKEAEITITQSVSQLSDFKDGGSL